jgi:hypothetical protein
VRSVVSEAGSLEHADQLRRYGCRIESHRRILCRQLALRERLTQGARVRKRQVEGRIDEVDGLYAVPQHRLFDLVHDLAHFAQPVGVAFDVVVDAVRAFQRAAALGLHRIRRASLGIARQIEPTKRLAARRRFQIVHHGATAERLADELASRVEHRQRQRATAATRQSTRQSLQALAPPHGRKHVWEGVLALTDHC